MYNILLIFLLIFFDQAFKYLATMFLSNGVEFTVVPGVLGLKYVLNSGAGFSILSGKVDFLIVVTSVALFFIGYLIFSKRFNLSSIEKASFILIFSGGIGNLIDRITKGVVVDYLEFLFIKFPIFNFADILICCGVVMFAIYTIFSDNIVKKNGK